MTLTGQKTERMIIKWGYGIDAAAVAAIRKRFNIPTYTTLNRFSPVEIAESDMKIFEHTAQCGFFTIFRKKWRKNGVQFIF